MASPDVHGPIDVVVMEFPAGTAGAETTRALTDLVELGVVRLYDLLLVRKGDDGRCEEIDLAATDGVLDAMASLAGARSGLLGSDDVDDLTEVLEPGTTAAVILYENAWAVPFVAAARGEGGELVATARLTAQEIMDALDAADAAD